MEKGVLKIKESRKVKLKVSGKELSNINEFNFSMLSVGNYECDVERSSGQVINIIVNKDPIPKNAAIIAQREERKEKAVVVNLPLNVKSNNFYLMLNKPIASRETSVKEVGRDREKVTFVDSGLFINEDGNIKSLKMKKYSIRDRGRETEYSRKDEIEKFNFTDVPFSKIQARQKAIFDTFKTKKSIENLNIDGKLAIGLGAASVYETGINLHHIYGIPFLPASSIKGITRSWVIANVFESEKEALKDKAFCDIFGCSGEAKVAIGKDKVNCKSYYKLEAEKNKDKKDLGDRAGNIIFLDAFPIKAPNVRVDVMTPHYGEWYGEGKPPVDTMMPVPIPFLVLKNTQFSFYFGLKNEYDENIGFKENENKPILDLVETWLKFSLTQHGIGAKTAVGYGYFQ